MSFGAVHTLYNAQEGGRGFDNLLYALYKGGWVVFANVI